MSLEEHIYEPEWIKVLVNRVVEAVEPLNLLGPFGFRWLEPDTETNPNPFWIVAMYPTPNEAYGGQHDGEKLYPGFVLNVAYVMQAFASVEELEWSNPTVYNGELDGPELSLKGFFAGYPVWLRLFNVAPGDERPTLVVDVATGNWWEKQGQPDDGVPE